MSEAIDPEDDATPPLSPDTRPALPPIVWILSVIAICVAIGFGIVAPALPIFARKFDVGITAAGLVISVFAAMRMVSLFGVGWIVDRIGARFVLGTGLVIVSVSSALAGLSQSYAQLLVLRGIGGIGSAMFSVASASVMANRIPSAIRGRAMSVWSGSFLLGGVLGPVIGGPLTAISLRAPFFFYAGTLAIAAVVTFAALPHVPRAARGATRDDTHAGTKPDAESAEGPLEGAREALRLPQFRIALVGSFSQGWSVSARNLLVPLFITEVLLRSEAWGGYALAIAAAVNAVFLLPLGRFSDSHGRLPVTFIGGAAAMVGMAALAAPPAMWLMVAAMALLGAGGAAQAVGPSAIMGDVAQGRRSSVIATYQETSDIGTVLGPIVAGVLADTFGYSAGFAVTAAICAVAAAVTLPYIRSERTPHAATGTVSDEDGTVSR
ncbi:MAG: MFS transporter [Nakamurella sp.]